MEWLVQSMLSNAVAVTALAALVAILGRSCRRPAWIHGLCLLAFLKLVTPPFVPVAMPDLWISSMPVPAEVGPARSAPDHGHAMGPASALTLLDTIEDQPHVESGGGETFTDSHPPTTWNRQSLVLGLVFAGALSWWSLAALRIVRFQRVLRDVAPMPGEWQARIGELARQMALRRTPTVCLVPGEIPPMLWAVGRRPRLLVPRSLWEILSEDQRRSLILHELAHLKRRDHWVRWLELFAIGLYWWHPAVWWLRRALREAEEQCCDAWVVWTMPGEARTYATALVAALEYVSGVRTIPAAASVVASATLGNGHVSCLKRRLRMIVRAKTPQRLSLVGRFAFVGLAALLLPLAPSWAHRDEAESPTSKPDQNTRDSTRKDGLSDSIAKLDAEIAVTKNELATLVRDEAGRKTVDTEPTPLFSQVTRDQYNQIANALLQTEMEMLETQAELETAQSRLALSVEAQQEAKAQGETDRLNARVVEEFEKDPETIALIKEIKNAEKSLEHARIFARQPTEPSLVVAHKHYKSLMADWENLWAQKKDKIEARAAAEADSVKNASQAKVADLQVRLDTLKKKKSFLIQRIEHLHEGDAVAKGDDFKEANLKQELDRKIGMREIAQQKLARLAPQEKSSRPSAKVEVDQPKPAKKSNNEEDPSAAERIEKELKDLVEKLGKDVSPVGEQVRKALERAVGEIHQSLTKEGLTADDVRRALERSGEELRKSFERGGPVEKEMREALERAHKELQEAMEHGRHEADRIGDEMRKQMDEARDKQREAVDELRKRAGNREESTREPILPRELPGAETRPDAAKKGIDRRGSGEPEAMREKSGISSNGSRPQPDGSMSFNAANRGEPRHHETPPNRFAQRLRSSPPLPRVERLRPSPPLPRDGPFRPLHATSSRPGARRTTDDSASSMISSIDC